MCSSVVSRMPAQCAGFECKGRGHLFGLGLGRGVGADKFEGDGLTRCLTRIIAVRLRVSICATREATRDAAPGAPATMQLAKSSAISAAGRHKGAIENRDRFSVSIRRQILMVAALGFPNLSNLPGASSLPLRLRVN